MTPIQKLGSDIRSAISLAPPDSADIHPLFVPPASNTKGVYATLSVAVTPEIKAIIERTTHKGIATGMFPWRTPSELTRWCIITSLKLLSEIADDERLALPYQQVVLNVEDLESTRTQIQAIYSRLSAELHQLIQIGKGDAAQTLLQQTLTDIDTLPSTPWREWLIEELARQFPTLLTSAPKPADLQPASGRAVVRQARAKKKTRTGREVIRFPEE